MENPAVRFPYLKEGNTDPKASLSFNYGIMDVYYLLESNGFWSSGIKNLPAVWS